MIKKYYLDSDVRNSGEQKFASYINHVFRHDSDHHWHVLYRVQLNRHHTQKEGEIDFVLICEKGILVVECKGGVISCEDGVFYRQMHHPQNRSGGSAKSTINDPFAQASGNDGALLQHLKNANIRNAFIGRIVFFADCTFADRNGTWRDEEDYVSGLNQNVHGAVLNALQTQKKKASEKSGHPDWFKMPRLTVDSMEQIAKLLSPNVTPDSIRDNINFGVMEVEKLVEIQESIFSGLNENQRLMIQGPPGSGKSRAAKQFMLSRNADGAKGLYLCWNNFLSFEMKSWVEENELDVEADRYFYWVRSVLKKSGMDASQLTYDNYSDQLVPMLGEAIAQLAEAGQLPRYDYIIVDEAQDIFHLGIDHVLDTMIAGTSNGLTEGNYWLLYDTLQAYREADTDIVDLLKMYAAHFRLKNRFRAAGTPGILKLVTDIDTGNFREDNDYGLSVEMKVFENPDDIVKHIRHTWNEQQKKKNYSPEKAVALFASHVLDPLKKEDREFNNRLDDAPFELMTKDNMLNPKGLQYTTILRFKGLERDAVFLVIKSLKDAKEMYQFFIGASRARAQLHVCILKD